MRVAKWEAGEPICREEMEASLKMRKSPGADGSQAPAEEIMKLLVNISAFGKDKTWPEQGTKLIAVSLTKNGYICLSTCIEDS